MSPTEVLRLWSRTAHVSLSSVGDKMCKTNCALHSVPSSKLRGHYPTVSPSIIRRLPVSEMISCTTHRRVAIVFTVFIRIWKLYATRKYCLAKGPMKQYKEYCFANIMREVQIVLFNHYVLPIFIYITSHYHRNTVCTLPFACLFNIYS